MSDPARPVAYVLDQQALAAYARQVTLVVPSLIATAIERQWNVAVSALALAKAYRELRADQADTLDLITRGELAAAVLVDPFGKATARNLGRRAVDDTDWKMAALHTAALAEQHRATVVAGEPGPVRDILGADWPILNV